MKIRLPKAVVTLFAAILVFHSWSLMRFPPPNVDEAWYAARAWSFLQTGRAFGVLDIGVIDRFEGYWTFLPWLPTWIQSLSLRFVDAPSLLAVRIVSLGFGFLLLVAIYIIASHLGGQRLGLLSTLLVSLSRPFINSAHIARHDIFAAALGFVAIALYLKNRARYLWVSFLSGLLVGLAFEIHPHSAIFGPAIVALFFLDLRWSMLKSRIFWGFVTGGLVGLSFYVVIHILPFPQTFYSLNKMFFAVTHTPPLFSLDPFMILQSIYEMLWLLLYNYMVLIPIVILSIVVLIKTRSNNDRVLLILAFSLVAGATLLIRNKADYYSILYSPTIDLILASFLIQFIQQPWQGKIKDYAVHVLVWVSLLGFISLNVYSLRIDCQKDYQSTQNRINSALQPTDIIMGAQTYWFDLYDHPYYSWEQLVIYQRYVPGSTLTDALQEFQPDIFIIDGHVNQFIADTDGTTLYSQHLRIPKTELDVFLTHQATLIADFDGGSYGQVRMYRIKWEED